MKQVQIVLGIVLTLALCYGAVLVSGGFEAGDGNDTGGVKPITAGGAFVSQSIINATHTTENATGNATLEEPDPLPRRTTMPHDAAPVQQASGGDGGGGGPSSSPAPTATPAANVTGNVTATPTDGGSSTPSPTSTSSSPTLTPTPEPTTEPADDPACEPAPSWKIESWTELGVADVTRTHYNIYDCDRGVMYIIVETEFPELATSNIGDFYNELYYFVWRETSSIYGEYHAMRQLYKNDYRRVTELPVENTAILVYSEEGRGHYAICEIDFTKSYGSLKYPPELPFRLYRLLDGDIIPEQTATKPRYFDMPRSNPTHPTVFLDRATPDRFAIMPYHGEIHPNPQPYSYLPTQEPTIEPASEPTSQTTPTAEPTVKLTPTPEPTFEPPVTLPPTPTPEMEETPIETPVETPTGTPGPERTYSMGPYPPETSTEAPAETLVEPQEPSSVGPGLIEEPTPAEDGNKTA